jgi:hypothetical protein
MSEPNLLRECASSRALHSVRLLLAGSRLPISSLFHIGSGSTNNCTWTWRHLVRIRDKGKHERRLKMIQKPRPKATTQSPKLHAPKTAAELA